jgi:hypothetical protein
MESGGIGVSPLEAMSPEQVIAKLRKEIGRQVVTSDFEGDIYFRQVGENVFLVTLAPSRDTQIILKVDNTTDLDVFFEKIHAILSK